MEGYGVARTSGNSFGYPPQRQRSPICRIGETCFTLKIKIAFGTVSRLHWHGTTDSYEVEYRFRRGDDSYAVVLDRAYIVYDEAGEAIRAIGAITDLSDRRDWRSSSGKRRRWRQWVSLPGVSLMISIIF